MKKLTDYHHDIILQIRVPAGGLSSVIGIGQWKRTLLGDTSSDSRNYVNLVTWTGSDEYIAEIIHQLIESKLI